MRTVINGLVVVMLAVPAVLVGQAGDVQKVLADMKTALGGEERVAGVRALTATGRTLRTSQAGTTSEQEFELALELPDKYMLRTVLANMGNMSVYRNSGFNGNGLINLIDQPPSLGGGGGAVAVRMMVPGGVGSGTPTPEQQVDVDRQLLQQQKREFGRLVVALFGSSYAGFPVEFSLVGEAEAADGKAWVIDVRGADEFETRLFVDTRTHLPLMQSWMAMEPITMTQTMGRGGAPSTAEIEAMRAAAEANRRMVEHRIYYSNYRAVSGVRFPHTMQRAIDGRPVEEMTFEQIRVNPKIDARKFEVTK